jgi:LCP family protein required for cell wall assembly
MVPIRLDSIQPPKKFKIIRPRKSKFKKWLILILIIVILGLPIFYIFRTGLAFSQILTLKNISWEKIFSKWPSSEYTPPRDLNRINTLLLGIRGEGDPDGGSLTDGIMVISFNKNSGRIALISLPRDFYLQLPGETKYEKVNDAYVIGLEKYNNGLDYAKKTVAYITGLYIDYAAAINFEAFKDVIDLLGGVTIYLDKSFIEDKQWWCDAKGMNCQPFIVEAGKQTLDGERALFYVRSRFSSNDFDRARRQQQILLALKDKMLSLGVLADPIKISGILDVLSKNVKTDVTPWEVPKLLELAKNANTDNIIRKVFDNSEQSFLYEATINGIYVLLPKEGNFDKIREVCQNIFNF